MESNKKFNYIRSKKLSFLNWKNINLLNQINEYLDAGNIITEEQLFLNKLRKNISSCASYSLYQDNKDVVYIGSHTCNHRGCNICNSQRQKRIRRKYFKFFNETPELVKVKTKQGKNKVYTQNYYNEVIKNRPGYVRLMNLKYDLMSLTVTVRHSEKGFNGNKYYYDDIMQMFHNLRNSKGKIKHNNKFYTWNDLVFGGEFGIETTVNKSGFHIHIHSLLFVRKTVQNRNILHKLVLKQWNKLTINKDFKKRDFREDEITAIIKGNKLLDSEFINKLDRRGATLINLENIYYYENNKKIRPRDLTDLTAVKRAVLETISYHFKPGMFETDKENVYDLGLISKVLPRIYKKRLYGKFGCLYFEKSLSLQTESLQSDFSESKELTEVEEDEGDFYIIQPAKVFHFDDKIILRSEIKEKKLTAGTTTQAINMMSNIYKSAKRLR